MPDVSKVLIFTITMSLITLIIEAVSTFETSISMYHDRLNFSEDNLLQPQTLRNPASKQTQYVGCFTMLHNKGLSHL
jgi:hypothetical protein